MEVFFPTSNILSSSDTDTNTWIQIRTLVYLKMFDARGSIHTIHAHRTAPKTSVSEFVWNHFQCPHNPHSNFYLSCWNFFFLFFFGNLVVGPGCSSLGVGAFSENGPFRPSGKALVRNEYSWNRGSENFPLQRNFILWVISRKSRIWFENDFVVCWICRSKYVVFGDTNWSWVLLLKWYFVFFVCQWQDHRHVAPILSTLYPTFIFLTKNKIIPFIKDYNFLESI